MFKEKNYRKIDKLNEGGYKVHKLLTNEYNFFKNNDNYDFEKQYKNKGYRIVVEFVNDDTEISIGKYYKDYEKNESDYNLEVKYNTHIKNYKKIDKILKNIFNQLKNNV